MEARVQFPAGAYQNRYKKYVNFWFKLSYLDFSPVQHAFNYTITWKSDAPYNIISKKLFEFSKDKPRKQMKKIGFKTKTISEGIPITYKKFNFIYQYQFTRASKLISSYLSAKLGKQVNVPDRIYLSFYSDWYREYSFLIELILGKMKTTAIIKPRSGLKHDAKASIEDAKEFLSSFGVSFEKSQEEMKSTEAYVRINRQLERNIIDKIDYLSYFFEANNIAINVKKGIINAHVDKDRGIFTAEVNQWLFEFKDFNAYIKLYYPTNPLAIPNNSFTYHPKLEVKLSKSKKYKKIEDLNNLARGILLYLLVYLQIKPSQLISDPITKHQYFKDVSLYNALLTEVRKCQTTA